MVRNRITISRWTTTQDSTGSLVKSLDEAFGKWAEVENRGGSVSQDQGKREWNYDYRFKVRYTSNFVERTSDTVTFNGSNYLIQHIQFEEEGNKRYVILRCSKVE